MKKLKVKFATIARIAALFVALVNESLILFGGEALSFSASTTYKVLSFIFMIIVAGINAWYNNDISKLAIICGRLFDALQDNKLTEEEIDNIMTDMQNVDDTDCHIESTFVSMANWLLGLVKDRTNKKE